MIRIVTHIFLYWIHVLKNIIWNILLLCLSVPRRTSISCSFAAGLGCCIEFLLSAAWLLVLYFCSLVNKISYSSNMYIYIYIYIDTHTHKRGLQSWNILGEHAESLSEIRGNMWIKQWVRNLSGSKHGISVTGDWNLWLHHLSSWSQLGCRD